MDFTVESLGLSKAKARPKASAVNLLRILIWKKAEVDVAHLRVIILGEDSFSVLGGVVKHCSRSYCSMCSDTPDSSVELLGEPLLG
jgi:hypothetical protein